MLQAWTTRKGLSTDEAMEAYIAEVDAQFAKYGN